MITSGNAWNHLNATVYVHCICPLALSNCRILLGSGPDRFSQCPLTLFFLKVSNVLRVILQFSSRRSSTGSTLRIMLISLTFGRIDDTASRARSCVMRAPFWSEIFVAKVIFSSCGADMWRRDISFLTYPAIASANSWLPTLPVTPSSSNHSPLIISTCFICLRGSSNMSDSR